MADETKRLIFKINGHRLAVALDDVYSIVGAEHFYAIPGQAPPIKGMISLRGEAIAVADIKELLGASSEDDPEKSKKVIIVKDKSRTLGLSIGDEDVLFEWQENLDVPGGDGRSEETRSFDWIPVYDKVTAILSSKKDMDENSHS